MSQRRMFSPEIVSSDAFLEMPPSTQALYFQLGMKADDDGFVNPKMVMRIIGSTEDELKVLITKRFVLPFENGVIVIKHWKVNNLIRKDWYRPTIYIEEKSQLFVKSNGIYTKDQKQGDPFPTIENESLTNRQRSIGKDSIGNISKEKKYTLSNSKKSISYLKEIPEQDMKELCDKFKVDSVFVKARADDVIDYCESKGKKYKNYLATLRNFIKSHKSRSDKEDSFGVPRVLSLQNKK